MFRGYLFIVLLIGALGFFGYSCQGLIRKLAIGRSEKRFDHPVRRVKNVLKIALGQSKLLRDPAAGLMHFFIFWGFMILLSAVAEAVIQGIYPSFSIHILGPLFPPLAAAQEAIGGLVILSCIFALLRWFLFSPNRYFGREITGHVRLDASAILLLILSIMLSMFGTNATRMLQFPGEMHSARFISIQASDIFTGSSNLHLWQEAFWWTHILVILGFLNYLPYSKHLHVITSIPNVYLASLRPRGELAALNFEDETVESFGASDVTDLTWKQLLDGFTCTDCGRCTAACPASITGKPLSPRKIIMNVRERTSEFPPAITDRPHNGPASSGRRLLDGFVSEQELWDCTTCSACIEECPVMIEHVPTILEMRRYLVLTESRFPQELTQTYKNLEATYNPWGFSPDSREDWAKGLEIKTMAQSATEPEILFWVGCAGAFDARYQKVSRSLAQLMNAAGVRFAILGKEEKCNGDPARRSGNEYLAQTLIADNIETLKRYNVRKIVASCPHCFNALKNDYPQFGGTYEVLHHTEFLGQLIQSGRLALKKGARERIVFHDSCYIGRYSGNYATPRRLIAASGSNPIEMRRSRSRGLCCGAGGARMFMEEKIGKRINVERTEEALALNPRTIATECPFCMTMLTDGLKAKDADERVAVRDVAEILAALL